MFLPSWANWRPPASDDANFFDDLYPDITEGEPGEDEEIVTDEDVSFMEVLKAVGIMEGDTDGDLHPFRKITRAEMAAVLLRLQNISAAPAKNGQQAFYDVFARRLVL